MVAEPFNKMQKFNWDIVQYLCSGVACYTGLVKCKVWAGVFVSVYWTDAQNFFSFFCIIAERFAHFILVRCTSGLI